MSLTGPLGRENKRQGFSGMMDVSILEVGSPPKLPCIPLVHLDKRGRDEVFLGIPGMIDFSILEIRSLSASSRLVFSMNLYEPFWTSTGWLS